MLTLLSMLGGGFMRFLPELLSLFNKRTDNAHELAMLEKQFQLEQTRAQARMDEIRLEGDINQTLSLLSAQQSALSGQMQKTGFMWVDALNFLVRPITTYYFLITYGVVKTATLFIALQEVNAWQAIIQCWNQEDMNILSGILAFWFVGRVFDKQK